MNNPKYYELLNLLSDKNHMNNATKDMSKKDKKEVMAFLQAAQLRVNIMNFIDELANYDQEVVSYIFWVTGLYISHTLDKDCNKFFQYFMKNAKFNNLISNLRGFPLIEPSEFDLDTFFTMVCDFCQGLKVDKFRIEPRVMKFIEQKNRVKPDIDPNYRQVVMDKLIQAVEQ